jgi:diguanylate cyclase (GGDEF)-like protein
MPHFKLIKTSKNGEDKCMPSLLARLFIALCCLCTSPAWAANAALTDSIVLDDATPSLQLGHEVQSWLDVGSTASMASVAGDSARFKSGVTGARHALTQADTLWIKLRLQRTAGSQSDWTLNIPIHLLDSVTLHQRASTGKWSSQSAGDTLAQSEWHKRSLYPEFDLDLLGDTASVVYLQIRNITAQNIPIRLATKAQRETQRQVELLVLGLSMGALLSLSVLSIIRFAEHRNPVDVWAALYSLLILITLAQINGALNATLWANNPHWGDYASSLLPPIAVGCALLFVQLLYALSTQYHRYGLFFNGMGAAAIASVLSFAVLDRSVASVFSDVVLLACICAGMLITVVSWHKGSPVRRLLAASTLPQFFGVMYMFADSLGLVPEFWQMRYLTSLFAAVSVPVTVYVLAQITHSRKERVVRTNQLPTQDALTGLLIPSVFQVRLDEALQRATKNHEPISLAIVQVANHDFLRRTYGDAIGEQCLLRAVIKLQRVLRDVDPAARVDTAQFALLMHGVPNRAALTERMVQLVASGLIPLPALVPEVTLHFQAACVVLHENPVGADRVISDLQMLLAEMSPQTRKPIRFLDAMPTESSGLPAPA